MSAKPDTKAAENGQGDPAALEAPATLDGRGFPLPLMLQLLHVAQRAEIPAGVGYDLFARVGAFVPEFFEPQT